MKQDWKRLGVHFKDIAQGIRGAHALKEIARLVTIIKMSSHSLRNYSDFTQDIAEIMDKYEKGNNR